MPKTRFRTGAELDQAEWAEKYRLVSLGKLYSTEGLSPFPIHEYFKLGLLGRQLKMLEVNAGHALVENMVADTLTDMSIQIGDDPESGEEQEILEWFAAIDMEAKVEEAARDYYGVGYALHQPFRTAEGAKNRYTVATQDPSIWYPTVPTFIYQSVTEGRLISVFPEEDASGNKTWYAFVEQHAIGSIAYQLLKLERQDALEGQLVPLTTLSRFEGLKDQATDLEELALFQIDRKKNSGSVFGQSVLFPVWGILQEISEIQTQIRQERIKHFRSKMFAPRESLTRVERDEDTKPETSKARAARGGTALFDLNQEIFPVPPGSQPPGFILWPVEVIEKASAEIDKLLSRAAAIAGCPRSVFNLDDKGDIHVETEKRKDRKYVRQIMQGQRAVASLLRRDIGAWRRWNGKKDELPVTVSFSSPFDLTRQEVTELMREMNPSATFVSEQRAIKEIWKDMKPEDRQAMQEEIEEERHLSEPPPMSALNRIQPIEP